MELFDKIVTETVRSGNEPLKLTYVGIYDGHLGRSIAYRTQTEIFSASFGTVSQESAEKADLTPTGCSLTERNVIHAARELKTIMEAGIAPEWISVKASTSFLLSENPYDVLAGILDKEQCDKPEKICFEFNRNIFGADREKVRKSLADLKTLGFKTLLGNFATDGFPITTLLDVPVDHVVLTPEVTALALDRNKEDVLPSLVRFLRSMNVQTIAAGVRDDAEIKELNKMECYGLLPVESYTGRFTFSLVAKGKYDYLDVIETDGGER